MTGLAKNRVNLKLTDSQPDPNARPATPEPTTASGIEPKYALYDNSPSQGTRSAEFRSGSRKRRSTERGESYVAVCNRAEDIREKGNWTRRRNNALRACIAEPGDSDTDHAKPATSQPKSQRARGPLPAKRCRGRSRTGRHLLRSPTPGSTDQEIEAKESTQPSEHAQETLPIEALHAHARKVFGEDFLDVDTQVVLQRLQDAPHHKAAEMAPPRQSSSVVVLQGEPLQVGGGWHCKGMDSQAVSSCGKKRASDEATLSQGSSKQARGAPVDDSATEPETSDEPLHATAARLVEACAAEVDQRPDPHRPSGPGTHPPAPSPAPECTPQLRESTATTMLNTSISFTQSRSVGADSSHWGQRVSPLPMLLSGPVQTCVPPEMLQRFLDGTAAAARASRAAAAAAVAEDAAAAEATNAAGADAEIDKHPKTEIEEVLETDLDMANARAASSAPIAQNPALRRTYQKNQSHTPSPSESRCAGPSRTQPPIEVDDDDSDDNNGNNNNGDEPLPGPNSPLLTNAQLIQRERTRAVTAKHVAKLQDQAAGHPDLADSLLKRLTCRCLELKHARRRARVDRATSFVQSATRQSQRTAWCQAPASRPRNELLPDDKEDLAHAEALANNRWPDSSRPPPPPPPPGRKRKQKPLARDLLGVIGQVVTVAKIHLFVYALIQGIYQTHATFLRWAVAMHEATWEMELPTTPYTRANQDVFEIMVNNLATLRGRLKERICAFVESNAEFRHSRNNQRTIQENLSEVQLVTYCPRSGHYENPELGHCIAVLLFYGPSSPGLMYPNYFIDMPLTVVAFALALWQFGLEEWCNGWHLNGDLISKMGAEGGTWGLGMSGAGSLGLVEPQLSKWSSHVTDLAKHGTVTVDLQMQVLLMLGKASMREKYEGQLSGLKQLRDVAPRRMEKLQRQWCKYIKEYSGASFKTPQELAAQSSTQNSEMRLDTPEPDADAISVDEMNEIIFETRRQESLREHYQVFADNAADPDAEPDHQSDEDDGNLSRSPTPPPEIDEQGRFTSRSKGKGRSN
ncbi:hypothetical protein BDV93DRAFT_516183 [Ceratobasidium sp. AG-I]|nr:hypothetical protein BDV93DRAFT_516183 [Ceratobasidium sp. AG-I]